MSISLRVESGSLSSKTVRLSPGQEVRVGREHPSHLIIGDDTMMSRVHFEISFDGQSIWLHDLRSTNGTYVNRNPVFRVELREGDEIRAGRTAFRIIKELDSPTQTTNAKKAVSPVEFGRLLASMRGELQPLYVVLDTARDPEIFKLLVQHRQPYFWLFEGEASAKLAAFAPYVVPLGPESPLLEVLLREGWGKNWGIYVSTTIAFSDLQWFLRRLLTAILPDSTSALLRYYDPRVFRTLILSATANQLNLLFSKVLRYIVEAEDPDFALGFSRSPNGLQTIHMPLSGQGEARAASTPPVPDQPRAEIADGMFRLRQDQMELLAAKKVDGLKEALMEDLRKFYPKEFAATGEARVETMIQHACQKAQKYGIRAQADLRSYVAIMMKFGIHFDVDPTLPWAAQILGMRLKPAEKMDRLSAAAKKAPAPGANQSTRLIPRLPA